MSEVDVKNCCYYNSDNEPYCCELYDNECEAQNCYYKQLQQLKAENEDLKQKLEKIKGIASAIIYGTHFTNDIEGHLKELVKDILEIIVGEE